MQIQRNSCRIAASLNHKGFSLVEVLVALFVLTIGLLGLAALQITGMKFTHQSYQRTQATMLIYDIIDRMRANPTGVTAGNYQIAQTNTAPPPPVNCSTASCTASEMATYDLFEWIEAVTGNNGNTSLANGEGEIQPNNQLYRIRVFWDEEGIEKRQIVEVEL